MSKTNYLLLKYLSGFAGFALLAGCAVAIMMYATDYRLTGGMVMGWAWGEFVRWHNSIKRP